MSVILETSELSKRFGPTIALDGVNLSVAQGELHALVGHNGAGKSTVAKILAGVVRSDEGYVELHGRRIVVRTPQEAEANGIGIVHQHPEMCGNMTVADNIVLGHEPRGRLGSLSRRSARTIAREALGRIDAEVDVDAGVDRLPVAERQLVAIARAVLHARDILVLDEPTAALSLREARHFFQLLSALRDAGFAILFITHRLEEVLNHCTHVTVLRGGRVVHNTTTDQLTEDVLLEAMLGRRLRAESQSAGEEETPAYWTITARRVDGERTPVEFSISQGRITGLLGIPGVGRESLMLALIGRDRSWRITIHDADGSSVRRPDPTSRGVGFVPNDRIKYGIFTNLSIHDNIAAGIIRAERRIRPFRVRRREAGVVRQFVERLSIQARSPDQMITDLSGGNQQKVLLSRSLASDPRVILLDEPTKGVDVGSRDDIYKLLHELSGNGRAVLVASQDEDELARYCDEIYILQEEGLHGPLVRPFDRHELVAIACATPQTVG